MRLLGAVRLSRLTDETSSPERQAETITLMAKARRDDLVAVVEDLDVSGAVDPFARAELGPWLTDPDKIAQWDGLIIAKLDRLTRSLLDFQRILTWCQQNGKTIISVSEGFDLGTPTGRLLANILCMFAQFERERIGERRGEAQAKFRQTARWGGGRAPFGYVAVKNHDGWYLEPDPDSRAVWACEQIIAGKSASEVARELGMTAGNLIKILRHPTIKGWVLNYPKGRGETQVVRGDDGMPVTREPAVPPEVWAKVQVVLDKNGRPDSGKRRNASPLLQVAFCPCGKPLYRDSGSRHAYYRCADRGNCKARAIPVDDLHERIDSYLRVAYGDSHIPIKVEIAAEDHTQALADVDQAIADLEADRYERGLFKGEDGHQALRGHDDQAGSQAGDPGRAAPASCRGHVGGRRPVP